MTRLPGAPLRAHALVCVRFAGLAMVAASLPAVGHSAGRIFKNLMLGNWGYLAPWIDYGNDDVANWAGWWLLLAMGVYFVRGGGRVASMMLAPLEDACVRCGYPLASLRTDRCPECGDPISQEPAGSGGRPGSRP